MTYGNVAQGNVPCVRQTLKQKTHFFLIGIRDMNSQGFYRRYDCYRYCLLKPLSSLSSWTDQARTSVECNGIIYCMFTNKIIIQMHPGIDYSCPKLGLYCFGCWMKKRAKTNVSDFRVT